MLNPWKQNCLTVAALMVGLAAGAALTTLIAQKGQADAQPSAAIEPAKTCYVDFIKLLKEDTVLLGKQIEIAQGIEAYLRREAESYQKRIEAREKERKEHKPNTAKYRQATEDLIALQADFNRKKIKAEVTLQSDFAREAKIRYQQIRGYAIEIASRRGATEVMVISRAPAENLDFTELQRQLMVSPVLHWDPAYDITDEVEKRARLDMSNEECDAVEVYNDKGEKLALKARDEATNPDSIDYEIALKGKFKLAGVFSDLDRASSKRVPMAAKDANPVWDLPSFGTGTIEPQEDGTALYVAPDNLPPGADAAKGAIITIEVAPQKARAKGKTVRIRVLPPPKENK